MTGTLVPYFDTGTPPWFALGVVASGYPSFESAQIGIDDYLNVSDWDEIPNLGPGPSLHSQWSPGLVGVVTAQPTRSMIPQLMGSGGSSEEPGFTGPPPLSGGELGSVANGAPAGFRLLRPRKPPTA